MGLMKKYLAVLGRLYKISLAELEAVFGSVKEISPCLAEFQARSETPRIQRFGGSLKFAEKLEETPLEFLKNLPEGKITLGVSDYSRGALARRALSEALKLKKILARQGRSVRVIPNKEAILSTATSHHNQIAEKKNHVELIKVGKEFYRVIGVQNISEYAKRDQVRPARDAKVGMLPPKLAQILLNLNGELSAGARILDPFCGTGVVLQEAMLSGYRVLGSDLSEKMVEYSKRNLDWLVSREGFLGAIDGRLTKEEKSSIIERYNDACFVAGDAREVDWRGVLDEGKIDAVAAEVFLGSPMSKSPAEIKLREEKENCRAIILGFLKNLSGQVEAGTPVTLAIPAWLRGTGEYSRLNILDEIEKLGYNLVKFKSASQRDLLYFREGQIVAREIISLRKK